ncbi:MAG: DUF4157 domain-containing protein [Nitriliruptoraceae bacterium]
MTTLPRPLAVLIESAAATTIVAGVIGVVRQWFEAQAVRRGDLTPASAAVELPPRREPGPLGRRLAVWVPTPPRTPLGRLAAAAWAGPLTTIGTMLALLAGRRPRWDPCLQCLIVRGMRGPSAAALRTVGADANTIGQVVLSRRETPAATLLAHEAVHVRQIERLGPLIVPLYAWLGAIYGYRDHPLERAARLGARRSQLPSPSAAPLSSATPPSADSLD